MHDNSKVDDKIGSGVSRSERHEAHAAYGQKDQHSGTASLTSWIFILNLHLILALGSLTRLRSLVLSQFTPSRYIA